MDPLRRLCLEGAKFEWTPECQKTWDTIIEALVDSKGVYHPDCDLPFQIRSDASKDGLGAYLSQIVEVKDKAGRLTREERVIEYWSRAVPKETRNYEPRRLELPAVVLSLEHFRAFIEGHRTVLETDHKTLTFLRKTAHSSGQLARWAMRRANFDPELGYKPGKSPG